MLNVAHKMRRMEYSKVSDNVAANAAIKLVTPEQALAWLNKASYEKQRSIRRHWVKYLADEMSEDNFEQDTALTFMQHNGSLELVDGQHRLSAVIASEKPQRFVIVIRNAEGDEDVARAYYRLDQSLKRTVRDQYRVTNLSEVTGLVMTDLESLGSACTFINNGFQVTSSKRLRPEQREQMMLEYTDAASSFFEVRAGCRSEIKAALKRAATVAVAIVTYRYSAEVYGIEKIDEFWHGAIHDDGVPAKDARKVANRHFWTVNIFSGSRSGRGIEVMTGGESSRRIARCFNAWVDGQELSFARVTDARAPMLINGSPFDGK